MVTAMVSYSQSAHWGLSMGKQGKVKDASAPAGAAEAASARQADFTPRMALASAGPCGETGKIDLSSTEMVKPDTMVTAEPRIELATIEAPRIAPETAEPKPSLDDAAPDPLQKQESEKTQTPAAPIAESAGPRLNRFTVLAATLALAAAFGGMVGALAAYGLVRPEPRAVVAAGKLGSEEMQALKENVVQARVELAALKASIDASNRNASTQLTKITERIERMERGTVEPAARINKAVESLERLSRTEVAAAAKDSTGSTAAPPASSGRAGPLDGWVLRDVRRGTAFIEGRAGVMEVEQGDLVPGLGRIDLIRKQDGRWVVVTSKGTLIITPR
jgi:hypothetical protein